MFSRFIAFYRMRKKIPKAKIMKTLMQLNDTIEPHMCSCLLAQSPRIHYPDNYSFFTVFPCESLTQVMDFYFLHDIIIKNTTWRQMANGINFQASDRLTSVLPRSCCRPTRLFRKICFSAVRALVVAR